MTFMSSYLESHWASLGHLDLGSTALGWLALLHKCELEITSKDIEAPGEQCHE